MSRLSKSDKVAQEIATIEQNIRTGRGDLARRGLRDIANSRVPREHLLAVSALARRNGLSSFAVRLLHPIIRPSGKSVVPATEPEKAEYAASLTHLGASEESLEILKSLSPQKAPQALLFQCFALFSQWDYATAIPLLQTYTGLSSLDPYQKTVGMVNLASALIYERKIEEANRVVEEVLTRAEKNSYTLLLGNALELQAQNYVWSWKLDEADQVLNKALKHLELTPGLNSFFVEKWKVIVAFLKRPKSSDSRQALDELRNRALTVHSETVRDCDRFEVMVTKDTKRLHHLYFGTPFPSFRKRLLADLKVEETSLPDVYQWTFGDNAKTYPTLDLETGGVEGKRRPLKMGQLPHRLLNVLAQDFYRPVRLAVAHHYLYPGDYFHPTASPHRVHEAVRRLRAHLKSRKFPLAIEEKQSFYRLIGTAPCAIRIERKSEKLRWDPKVRLLLKRFGTDTFSVHDVAKALALSARSASRFLHESVAEAKVAQEGKGRATRYRVLTDR